jgi:hypothetical protein
LESILLTYEKLSELHPEDANCAFCGKKNDNWDQDGFFYLWTRPGMAFDEGEAACKKCMNGEPGQQHLDLHGPGDGNR